MTTPKAPQEQGSNDSVPREKRPLSDADDEQHIAKKARDHVDFKQLNWEILSNCFSTWVEKISSNLTSKEALQRFGTLPEVLQRKILGDYTGLRHTLASRIQQFVRDRLKLERALKLNELLKDDRDSNLYADKWNRDHLEGPWWREFECDRCHGFQWILSYENEDSQQPAYDEEWYPAGDMFLCPECSTNPDVLEFCEVCGEDFVENDINDMYRDEHTGDLFCENCFRGRYVNDFNTEEDLDRFIETRRLCNLENDEI